MPLYDYKCKKCQKIIEIEKSIKDDTKQICECGNEMIRLISKVQVNIWNCRMSKGKRD